MSDDALAKLRAPFPPEQIGKLPRAGVKLDYVGHAAVTHRLLDVDPRWSWEPFALDEHGLPLVVGGALWIRLTVCGMTRIGVGTVNTADPSGDDLKILIGDALRNAAMRFGVALDLWSKEDLHQAESAEADELEADRAAAVARVKALTDGQRAAVGERVPSRKPSEWDRPYLDTLTAVLDDIESSLPDGDDPVIGASVDIAGAEPASETAGGGDTQGGTDHPRPGEHEDGPQEPSTATPAPGGDLFDPAVDRLVEHLTIARLASYALDRRLPTFANERTKAERLRRICLQTGLTPFQVAGEILGCSAGDAQALVTEEA